MVKDVNIVFQGKWASGGGSSKNDLSYWGCCCSGSSMGIKTSSSHSQEVKRSWSSWDGGPQKWWKAGRYMHALYKTFLICLIIKMMLLHSLGLFRYTPKQFFPTTPPTCPIPLFSSSELPCVKLIPLWERKTHHCQLWC